MSRRSSFRPQLESLESRLALAGDVTAILSGADLIIQGDAAANEIQVSQNLAGDIIIQGTNTTVNGVASARFPGVNLIKADIHMGAGNDILRVNNLRAESDINVAADTGNDTVRLNGLKATNVAVSHEGAIANVTATRLSLTGDLNYTGQGTNNTVAITNSVVEGTLTTNTQAGTDAITLSGLTVNNNVNVELGTGDDLIRATDLVIGLTASFIGDEGIDRIFLTRVRTGEDLTVESGKGNDVVQLVDVFSSKSLAVNVDDGNDRVLAQNVTAQVDAIFTGGAGVDVLDERGIFAGITLDVKEFERIL